MVPVGYFLIAGLIMVGKTLTKLVSIQWPLACSMQYAGW